MNDEKLSQAVSAKLAELGENSDEVAASLRAAGCKGYRGMSCQCPVAAYLKSLGWGDPDVEPSRFVLYDEDTGVRIVTEAMPTQIREFVNAFDAGRYPHLDLHLNPNT